MSFLVENGRNPSDEPAQQMPRTGFRRSTSSADSPGEDARPARRTSGRASARPSNRVTAENRTSSVEDLTTKLKEQQELIEKLKGQSSNLGGVIDSKEKGSTVVYLSKSAPASPSSSPKAPRRAGILRFANVSDGEEESSDEGGPFEPEDSGSEEFAVEEFVVKLLPDTPKKRGWSAKRAEKKAEKRRQAELKALAKLEARALAKSDLEGAKARAEAQALADSTRKAEEKAVAKAREEARAATKKSAAEARAKEEAEAVAVAETKARAGAKAEALRVKAEAEVRSARATAEVEASRAEKEAAKEMVLALAAQKKAQKGNSQQATGASQNAQVLEKELSALSLARYSAYRDQISGILVVALRRELTAADAKERKLLREG